MKKLLALLFAICAFTGEVTAQKFSDFTAYTTPQTTDYLVGYRTPGVAGGNSRYSFSTLGTYFGTLFQPLDSDLTSIAAVTTTSFGRGLLAEASATSLKSTLSLTIGTNVEAWSANLDSWSAIAPSSKAASSHTHALSDLTQSGATTNQFPKWNGSAWVPVTLSAGSGDMLAANNLSDVASPSIGYANLGGMFATRAAKTSTYNVIAGDRGKLIDFTSGTVSLTFTAAATLGDGFAVAVWNSGSGTVTLDPNGSETIQDGAGSTTTNTLAQGQGGIVVCNGTGFIFYKFAGLVNSVTSSSGAGDSGKIVALNGSGLLSPTFFAAWTVPLGGTGLSTVTNHGVPVGAGTSALTVVAPGTTDFVFTANGSGADPSWQGTKQVIQIACSDTTTSLTTGTNKASFRMPFAATLTAVRASVLTASTGSTIIVDINESGTSVLSTKLSLDASEKSSTTAAVPAVISDSALADDAEITIDFDQVGSSTPGAGLIVTLYLTRT